MKLFHDNRCAAFLVAWILGVGPARGEEVVFVDDDAPAGGDGSTWATAYRFLADALDDPRIGPGAEVRVAQGVYKPDRRERHPSGNGDRAATFALTDGITLAGGYAGLGASDPDARDPERYPTSLDGDLAGDDGPAFATRSENSRHVLTAIGVSLDTVLGGVVVSGGNLDTFVAGRGGGGIIVENAGLVIDACVFRDNLHSAGGQSNLGGGAVYVAFGEAVVTACVFEDNLASTNGTTPQNDGAAIFAREAVVTVRDSAFRGNVAGRGGAISLVASAATVERCHFEDNHGGGGAIRCGHGDLYVTRCTFIANTYVNQGGSRHGGAIHLDGSGGADAHAEIANSFFRGNVANRGGAIYAFSDEDYLITNCVFIGNSGLNGGGIAGQASANVIVRHSSFANNSGSGIRGLSTATIEVTNSIMWGDRPVAIESDGGAQVAWSIVEGGWPGAGNLDADPQYLDVPGGDLRLAADSPAIDSASNGLVPPDELDLDGDGDVTEPLPVDFDDAPRFADDEDVPDTGKGRPPIVDRGAYERQPAALAVALDVRPGSCPNPLNRASQGMLPAAIAGTRELDASLIDVASIMLARADGVGGTVAPHEGPPGPHSVIDDVATPFDGDACACDDLEGDGIDDLSMKFDVPLLVEALALADASGMVEVIVTGALVDGTPIEGRDCIQLVPPSHDPPHRTQEDARYGFGDVAALLSAWGPCIGCAADLDGDGTVAASDLLALLDRIARGG